MLYWAWMCHGSINIDWQYYKPKMEMALMPREVINNFVVTCIISVIYSLCISVFRIVCIWWIHGYQYTMNGAKTKYYTHSMREEWTANFGSVIDISSISSSKPGPKVAFQNTFSIAYLPFHDESFACSLYVIVSEDFSLCQVISYCNAGLLSTEL